MHPFVLRLAILAPLVLGACSSTPIAPANTTAPASSSQPAGSGAGTSQASSAVSPVNASDPSASQLGPNALLGRERSVYFGFDDAVVRSEYAALVQRHGEYLQHNPALKVVVQGNTDERGGSEYNLALGQRRAEAVRATLAVYGVKDSQVEAISFGKERPAASGHDEAAWQKNRRADLVYNK